MRKTKIQITLAWAACLCILTACGTPAAKYTTTTPQHGPLENIVEDTGTVMYRDLYAVIPVVNGKILSCLIAEGDAVTAGQTLYELDATDLENQISQARLALERAQVAHNQANAACDDLTVRSHASGTVTAVYVHEGDFVAVGTPVAHVVDSANLILTVPFAAAATATMTLGATADIRFSGYGDSLGGTVKRIYDTPTALPGGREGVMVEISFQNSGVFLGGETALASIGTVDCMVAGAIRCATDQSIYATQSGQVTNVPLEIGHAVTNDQTVLTLKNDAITNAVTNTAQGVASAAVSLEQLETKRPDFTILAPVDGNILLRIAKEGDYAAAASPLATIALADSMCIRADIDEIYIGRIWAGQAAQVSFQTDNGSETTYAATVRHIEEQGATAGGVTNYAVELTLDRTDGLKAGMNVSVTIVTDRRADCLHIPAVAVTGGTVHLLRDGKPETVNVTTGMTAAGRVEILSGLTEQDEVILP